MSEQEGGQDDGLRLLGITDPSTETVTIYGLTVPASFTTAMYRPGKPFSVSILVEVDPEHGPLPRGIQVNANPGTRLTYKDGLSLLKGEPVDQLLHQALLNASRALEWNHQLAAAGKLDERGKIVGPPLSSRELTQLRDGLTDVEAQIREVARPIQRRSVTRKLLEEVTTVYRQALEDGKPPTKSVAEHFQSTHASAARWVREARKTGLMGPSVGPTGGEASANREG
jgi:hypothetical protein